MTNDIVMTAEKYYLQWGSSIADFCDNDDVLFQELEQYSGFMFPLFVFYVDGYEIEVAS